MNQFLAACEVVDFKNESVALKAMELADRARTTHELIQLCFEFVRDEIKHSTDFGLSTVTIKASEVLKQGTGICYAKSHLLAALLRANSIPTALLYQRLEMDGGIFCLHGLNAVWMNGHEGSLLAEGSLPAEGSSYWYRIDARGNKTGVNAEFRPPIEKLAFDINAEGELDSTRLFTQPLPLVIEHLRNAVSAEDFDVCLPDSLDI